MTKGKCIFCGKLFTKRGITRHLQTCKNRLKELKEVKKLERTKTYFHLSIGTPYGNDYWMHIGIRGDTTLDKLDEFLRFEWVECCGHLSHFIIDDIFYEDSIEVWNDSLMGSVDMNVKIEDVLEVGKEFKYEYDYGSTTELILKVIDTYQDNLLHDLVKFAVNEPPEFKCWVCGKPATNICTECLYEVEYEKTLFCDECAEKHTKHEEFFLPVVNSPRMGVCGYTGD
jgi:hypothetical protein